MKHRIVSATLIALLAATSAAGIEAQQEQQSQEITLDQAAALLVQAGRLDDAKRVIELALQNNANDYEAIFLRAMIAVAEKNYDAAIADFRRILAAEPNRERVRLELARAFYLKEDYDNADRNFRFARAGELPAEVITNIDTYLAAIRRQKRWSYDLGLSFAEDTNVNGATNVRQVDLYGLPFTLSDTARQTSGTGVAIDAGGEYSPTLSDRTRIRLGGRVRRLEYGGGSFDDMTLAAYGGPEFLLGRWRLNVMATGFRRWFGNTPFSDGVGGRLSAGYVFSANLQVNVTFDQTSVTYRRLPAQDGPVTSGTAEAIYTLSPASYVRLAFGTAALDAKEAAFANTTRWVSIDYYRDLPFGFSANIQPSYYLARYNAPMAAFGATRSDNTWALRIDLLNRRIQYAGFAPRLSLIHVEQSSSIALFRFSRNQIQLGLTRQF
jgi:outer membrane protein